MKKKIGSLLLAAVMTVSLALPAMAADGFVSSPSGSQTAESQEGLEVVTDNVVTGGQIAQEGSAETRALDDIDYPVIKVTTLAAASDANAQIDAAYAGATAEQKAAMLTGTALSYGQNAELSAVAAQYYASATTSDFVGSYNTSLLGRLTVASGTLNKYEVVQIVDISANSLAKAQAGGSRVRMTLSAPGVTSRSRVRVVRINGGSAEFISATAGNGTVSFSVDVNRLGTFALMVAA